MGRQDVAHLSAQRRVDRHTLDEKRDRVRQQQQRQAMLGRQCLTDARNNGPDVT